MPHAGMVRVPEQLNSKEREARRRRARRWPMLAIRARVPLDVLRDVIQPFPTFSEIYVAALKALHNQITGAREPAGAGQS